MKLGHYELQAELGRGGMGIVYAARDPILNRDVAIKVLQGAGATESETLARFQREAEAASAMRHEGIVSVHAAGVDRGRPFLVMELVHGESLRGALRREGAFAPERAATLGRDVARALHHAHERGILHRDVKPENVLLDVSGHPRLTDFGVAALAGGGGRLTRDGEVVGTPCYMAPEQALGDRGRVGPWSDVYGLGAMLYELLAGQPPFAGTSAMAALESTALGRVPPLRDFKKGVDPELEQLVMRSLARDPQERIQSADVLADELEAWLAARRPVANRGRRAVVAPRARAGPGVPLLAIGAVAALATLAALGLLWALGRERDRAVERDRELQRLAARVAELEARPPADPAPPPPSAPAPPASAATERAATERPHARLPEVARLCEEASDLAIAGDLKRALELSERAVALDDRDVEALNNMGAITQRLGDTKAALAWLDRALQVDPRDALALANRAHARSEGGDLRGALEDATRALEVQPASVPTLRTRALARDRLGDTRGALEDFSRIVELQPDDLASRRNRGILRGRLGEHRAALADYDHVLERLPRDGQALTNRGVSRAELGDRVGAIADIERALEVGTPEPTNALGNLGAIHQLEGDHARAVEVLTRALDLDPDLPVVRVNRGVSRARLGDHAGALEDCTRAQPGLPRGSKKALEAERTIAEAREALGR